MVHNNIEIVLDFCPWRSGPICIATSRVCDKDDCALMYLIKEINKQEEQEHEN